MTEVAVLPVEADPLRVRASRPTIRAGQMASTPSFVGRECVEVRASFCSRAGAFCPSRGLLIVNIPVR